MSRRDAWTAGAVFLAMGLGVACGTAHPFDRGPQQSGTDGGNALTFRTDVEPILAACSGCHASGPGGFVLLGDAEADYVAARSRINAAQPEQSLLYLKATGQTSHQGGSVLAPTGPQAQTLLGWIAAGAKDD